MASPPVRGGERHGPYREYREDGSLRGEGQYRHGKRHGTWVIRRRDGSIDERFNQTFEGGVLIDG